MVIQSERRHDLGGRETPTVIFISTLSLVSVKGRTTGDDSEATIADTVEGAPRESRSTAPRRCQG